MARAARTPTPRPPPPSPPMARNGMAKNRMKVTCMATNNRHQFVICAPLFPLCPLPPSPLLHPFPISLMSLVFLWFPLFPMFHILPLGFTDSLCVWCVSYVSLVVICVLVLFFKSRAVDHWATKEGKWEPYATRQYYIGSLRTPIGFQNVPPFGAPAGAFYYVMYGVLREKAPMEPLSSNSV